MDELEKPTGIRLKYFTIGSMLTLFYSAPFDKPDQLCKLMSHALGCEIKIHDMPLYWDQVYEPIAKLFPEFLAEDVRDIANKAVVEYIDKDQLASLKIAASKIAEITKLGKFITFPFGLANPSI